MSTSVHIPSASAATPSPSPSTVNNPSNPLFTPPNYEETITRQRLLKHYNRSASFVAPSPTPHSPSPTVASNAKTR